MTYDRTSTGWDFSSTRGGVDNRVRSADERERCGPYTAPDGKPSWGDHRVTWPGTTCVDVNCQVAHHPTDLPGWAEAIPDFYHRPGARAVAAALYGWDAAGILPVQLGDIVAWTAAHVALDALRDAGYTLNGGRTTERDG